MTNEQLAIRIQAGIDVSDNMLQLWQQNRGFIYKLVNQYKTYAEEDDLEQEGYLGLSAAVAHYNPDEGVTFLHYASFWIKQYMSRYIKSNGTIRIPEFMQGRIREYNKMVRKWQQNYHRDPTDREICHFIGINSEMLDNLKKAVQMAKIGSLDVPIGEEGDCSMYDLLPAAMDEEEQTIEKIQHDQLCTVLWSLVDSLPGQQSWVIRAKYQEKRTLADMANEKGVTLGVIRQQEAKGLRELRKPSKSKLLRPFLPDDDRIYSMALQGNGVDRFNRTWTSSTERAALQDWETEEREWLKKVGCSILSRPESGHPKVLKF